MLSWSSSAHILEPFTRLAFMYSAVRSPQSSVLGARSSWQFDNGALSLQMDVRLPAAPLATATVAKKNMKNDVNRTWRLDGRRSSRRGGEGGGGEFPAGLSFFLLFLLLLAICQIFMLYLKLHKSRPYMDNMWSICCHGMVTLPMVIQFREIDARWRLT